MDETIVVCVTENYFNKIVQRLKNKNFELSERTLEKEIWYNLDNDETVEVIKRFN